MLSLLATAHAADLQVLFVVLAIVAFGLAVFAAFRGALLAAGALVLIGVLILIFGA